MTIFPINLGGLETDAVCPDRKVTGFDDTGLCGDRLAKVQHHRTAHPCRKDCVEMGFASCATKEPVEDCICQDGVTTEPGFLVTGGLIGWSDPVGETLTELAIKTGPVAGILGDPGAYYFLFGANDGTNINCPIDEDDWDAMLIDGDAFKKDLVASPLVTAGDECSGGVIALTLAQLQIEDGEGPAAGHCLQTGGRRAFAIAVKDCNGKRLMFCPIPGIVPPPQCDRVPCCNWDFTDGTPALSEDGTTATITVHVARPDNCTCTPETATVTIDNGDGSMPTVYPITTNPTLIDHLITPYTPGQNVTIALDQSYGTCDEPSCVTRHDETTVGL